MPRFLVTLVCCLSTAPLAAQTPAQREFFENRIRPVLVEHCYSCHSAEAKKQKGGLRLDHRDGWRKGGDSGPALAPGKPDESLLVKAIRYGSDELKMPPKGRLPAAVIADLEAWVAMGAPDPRDAPAIPAATAKNTTWDEMLRTRRSWWSLQPVRQAQAPTLKNDAWSQHPVDRFLLAKLEEAGLAPAPPADPRTLIRRLSLVLTGLPPAMDQVEDFVARFDASAKPQAVIHDAVDRLLDSPHFGERWARHWMDVVRFSETHGNEWNYDVHHAWRYRDYLIRAFNDDVPFDRLLREHIAGDLLPPRWNEKERFNESPIGTAFWRFGEVNHDDCIGLRGIGFDLFDNQIDTLTKAFQATTVACARCHDHKIDAVSMKDYYALLGIVRSSRPVSHTLDARDANDEQLDRLGRIKDSMRKTLGHAWQAEVQRLDAKRLDALKVDKTTWDHPLHLWRTLAGADDFAASWQTLKAAYVKEHEQRQAAAGQCEPLADVAAGKLDGWHTSGLGLRHSSAGDFTVARNGDQFIGGILPAGMFTHAYSEKLNGALRSPILKTAKKRISFRVVGNQQAAVRIVSNNCQLNYRNFRVLKSGAWHWITFDVPEDAADLRAYAELMTKFDNPKYPDQLGQLGGDDGNQRVPWEQAAADPHSYFGVTRVVLHDTPEPPGEDLAWLEALLDGDAPADRDALAARYRERALQAVRAWADDKANAADVRWLDWLLQSGLLSNNVKQLPALAQTIHNYRTIEQELTLARIAPGLADVDGGTEQTVFVRGDPGKHGGVVSRRYLEVLTPEHTTFTPRGSGRLALAEALAGPDNPLTARVMVNRIWQHVFGHGLVRTPDDFGRMGDTPSHPELLDWLAARFVADGWSVKKMIRLLVTTRAFQMSSRADARVREVDPLNRRLHHYPARRLEAEAIRDAILFASGRLDRAMFGVSIQPYREKANEDRRLFPGPLDGDGRRSIYIKVNLMEGARFLSAFDLPGGKVTQGRRDVTNVPAQALALLNDPFVLQQAEWWADRLIERPDRTVEQRLAHMFAKALSRRPSKEELARFEAFIREVATLHPANVDVLRNAGVWKDVAHALFNVKEFIYVP
jgi:hypothetical protein